MYRPNAPPVLLKKAVLRTVPGQAPGDETSSTQERAASLLAVVSPLPFLPCTVFFQPKPPKILH